MVKGKEALTYYKDLRYMHENGAERVPQGKSTHEGFINFDDVVEISRIL